MLSLNRRYKTADIQKFLRRVTDITNPCLAPLEGEYRSEDRLNRTIPVLLTPWEDDRVCVDETATALTKDFSGRGMSVVLHQPFRTTQVVIGFWLASETLAGGGPRFVLGKVKQNVDIGGGYWQLGVELNELLDANHANELEPLVPLSNRLLPRLDVDRLSLDALRN